MQLFYIKGKVHFCLAEERRLTVSYPQFFRDFSEGMSGKKKRKKISGKRPTEIIVTICFLGMAFLILKHSLTYDTAKTAKNFPVEAGTNGELGGILQAEDGPCGRPKITEDFLTENPYSRSGISLKKVRGVVIHYVGNAGTSAKENRDYFENLKDTHITKASSHYVIGLEGEILQCIPLEEISYASNNRNDDTISIECCHPKKNGKFDKKTYASLVQLTSWLCATYGLDSSDVIRHYDVTGKMCPVYYVRHEDAWETFLTKIQKRLDARS